MSSDHEQPKDKAEANSAASPSTEQAAQSATARAATQISGWRTIYAAIQLRLRFAVVLLALAALAAGWPWLTNIWDRILARLSPYASEENVAAGTDYFCPMDPGVVSDWPAICPVCNMDLIQRHKSDSQLLPSGVLARMQISPYRIALAGVRTVPVELLETKPSNGELEEPVLAVPVSSVVHWESQSIVYVESMPGMFDAVPVELMQREGNRYLVKSGLRSDQRVVAMGTLLIDAESRLHPHLATQYFGASGQSTNAPPQPIVRSQNNTNEPRTAADVLLAESQRYCPVTKAKLGSMGLPVFVEVSGRRIALCCEGCRDPLLADPNPYLNWLDERLASEQAPK